MVETEVHCLELKKMSEEEEITNLDDNIKAKLSFRPRRYSCPSD